jgi:hypothetical protein
LKKLCFVCVVCLLVAIARPVAAATITVNAGGDLQAALNAAQPGDTIMLQAGASWTGNYTLPLKSGTGYITVRSSASNTQLPAPGVRITPAYAPVLPKIKGAGTSAALKTAASAHHWRLQFLEIVGNAAGVNEIIRLGTGSETTIASQPQHIILDRVYIRGHATMGSRRGIAMNGGNLTVRDSWISDIKSVGVDSQALCGWNGAGPFLIENNYLSAGAENILFGGADPVIANLVPSDITIRRNLFTKDLKWRNPVLAAPKPTAAASTGGGALKAATYGYKVVAYGACGNSKMCNSLPSTEIKASVASSTGSVKLSWAAVTGATSYRVYGRTPGSASQYWTVTTTSFVDTAAAGTAGTPATAGTKYTVKNLLELKNARRVVIEGNRFEYSWAQDQTGYALLFMPRNGGRAPWTVVEDVTVRSNHLDHVAAGITIVGRHVVNGILISQITKRIAIVNNLLTDVSKARWGGHGLFLVTGDGATDVRVDHNTIIHDGPALVNGNGIGNVRFVYTNNLSKHSVDGIYGSGYGAGYVSLNKYFVAADLRRNVLAGGIASKYPPDNFFPPTSEFLWNFANATGGNYRLGTWSPYRAAGTDGKDVGVNIDALTAAMK